MNHFKHNIKLLRDQQRLTQAAAAEQLKVKHKTLAAWEEGRGIPDCDTLIAISEFYQISVDELLKEEL